MVTLRALVEFDILVDDDDNASVYAQAESVVETLIAGQADDLAEIERWSISKIEEVE